MDTLLYFAGGAVLFVLTLLAGIAAWLTRLAVADMKDDINKANLRVEQSIAEHKVLDTRITADTRVISNELANWKLSSLQAETGLKGDINRLDGMLIERNADLREIKQVLSDLKAQFVSKTDLREAIAELKELLLQNINPPDHY